MASNAIVIETVRTTKSGLDLGTFEDVKLFKDVPKIQKVTSASDALSRVAGNEERFLALLTEALQSEAVELARKNREGWLLFDDDGKPTKDEFSGTLANSDDVNPIILQFAKTMFGFDEIPKGDKSRELKRQAKESAMEVLKGLPQMIEALRKKAEKSNS